MYGTILRGQLKPGAEVELLDLVDEFVARRVPGFVAQYTYRMDVDPNVYMTAVIFESKDAYFANANSPDQDALYQRLAALFASEPEWHDGEIVYPR
ncbi:MAG: antibiotic biosynthesis monooxygenase [Anaerolineae bacterium]|nr:antibiotic biosynthesis monooxygenase [Anaerolineae bacterium]